MYIMTLITSSYVNKHYAVKIFITYLLAPHSGFSSCPIEPGILKVNENFLRVTKLKATTELPNAGG